jgi:hypothetical protein
VGVAVDTVVGEGVLKLVADVVVVAVVGVRK